MNVQIDLWQLVGVAGAVTGAVLAAFWAMARILATQAQAAIAAKFAELDGKFRSITEAMSKQDDMTRRIERDLMDMKAQLPKEYVRMENYVPSQAQILTKIDQLALRIENWLLKSVHGGNGQ